MHVLRCEHRPELLTAFAVEERSECPLKLVFVVLLERASEPVEEPRQRAGLCRAPTEAEDEDLCRWCQVVEEAPRRLFDVRLEASASRPAEDLVCDLLDAIVAAIVPTSPSDAGVVVGELRDAVRFREDRPSQLQHVRRFDDESPVSVALSRWVAPRSVQADREMSVEIGHGSPQVVSVLEGTKGLGLCTPWASPPDTAADMPKTVPSPTEDRLWTGGDSQGHRTLDCPGKSGGY